MGKRYFEFVEGSSSKFWEIWAEGSEVRTRYGRIGTSGQVTLKDEGSEAGAEKLLNKLIAEKTKKGYEEKTAGGAAEHAKAAPKPEAKAAPKAEAVDLGPALGRIEAKAKKAGVTLRKGASEKAIAAAEKALGQSLPEDVKAFYRAHDGSDDDPAVDNRELLSLERMVGEWKVWKDLLDKGTFEKNDHGTPGKGVQKKWWIAEWIPVTYDGSGNHHVIDLAPAKGGTVGQILDFWHDDDPRNVVAKSLVEWLEKAPWGESDEDDDDGDGAGKFRRFEMDEKFWAIALDEDAGTTTVRFGKIGTDGQEKTKDLGSGAAAKKEYDKLIAEKTKKGYEEV